MNSPSSSSPLLLHTSNNHHNDNEHESDDNEKVEQANRSSLRSVWRAYVSLCYVSVDSDTLCVLRIGFGLVMCLQYYHYESITGQHGTNESDCENEEEWSEWKEWSIIVIVIVIVIVVVNVNVMVKFIIICD